MSMAQARRGRQARKRARHGVLTLPVLMLAGCAMLAAGYVAYVLWPRWPVAQVALDAPSIPVTLGGTTFNIPPAAIRRAVQRQAGVQQRIDLAFLWPSLNPAVRPEPAAAPGAADRVFVTISASDGLAPAERIATIYPRYLDANVAEGPDGLAVRPFLDGTPYRGEALIYDPADAQRFTVRCSQNGKAGTPGICLYERRIGGADLVARFPRDWLDGWKGVAEKLEKLVAGFRATGA